MINAELHRQPVMLDRKKHQHLKLRRDVNPLAAGAGLNAFFIAGSEFADACKTYPIVFLPSGQDAQGKAQALPVAVFGLSPGENLFWQDGRWDAAYVPAMLRAYPFTLSKVEGDQYAMCFDEAAPNLSTEQGEPLFDAAGEPVPMLKELHEFVKQLEIEIERTRLGCVRLLELGLLVPRRFDATLSDGSSFSVDGFLMLDEDKLNKLPDTELATLQRSGLLGLLHAHQISLGNMRNLINRRLSRAQAATDNVLASAANA